MLSPLNPIEECHRSLSAQSREILKLFSGNPSEEGFLFPPEVLKASYERYLARQTYRPEAKGSRAAREAIAGYYEKQGCSLDPEHLILSSGTSESFFYLFSLLTEPGDNILAPNPAYPLFDYIAELAHVRLRHYPLVESKAWAVDVEALKAVTDERTKAIILISPNNPTGSVISAAQIREIAAWANEKHIPLICDEVFSEFYFGEGKFPRPIQVAKPDLCFTLNGISKMFALPSMKLAWIAVTGDALRVEPAVDRLETLADTFLSCHTAIQEALPDLFQKGWDFVEAYKKEVAERRNLAMKILRQCPQIEFSEPQGAFYLMMKIRVSGSEEDFVIDLMQQTGAFLHPGYFYDYEEGIHGVISFLCSRQKLEKGLQALVDFIHSK